MNGVTSFDVNAQIKGAVQSLWDGYLPGNSLPRPFYVDQNVFEEEVQSFIASHWMLVGHISELPLPGDFMTRAIAGYPIVVVRDSEGSIRAMHNVCRHRGARVCEAERGSTKRFLCRYHAWSYALDGAVASWRHMDPALSKADFALRPCGAAVFAGLIFISLDPDRSPDFAVLERHVQNYWTRYDLANCRVAVERVYQLNANWKLGVENNLECYHCLPSHPEYTGANAFVRYDEKVSASAVTSFRSYRDTFRSRMQAAGLPVGSSGICTSGNQIARAGTWPLAPGILTASADGQAVAPLLGTIGRHDESVTTGCFGFHSYVIAMCDYALLITYVPQSAKRTEIVAKWLVRADAREHEDYDAERLCWLWDETTKQDKDLIELNASGVDSPAYVPGPYSSLETLAADFVDRYVALMRGTADLI